MKIPSMMIRVDREHLESLVRHLDAQGFPAKRLGDDRLDVLFPASPTIFAPAVELDDWLAETGASGVVALET